MVIRGLQLCLLLVVGLWIAAPEMAEAAGCPKGETGDSKICKKAKRGPKGCCKIPKKPKRVRKPKKVKKAPKPSCPAGMEKGEYAKGHCCWPGQGWNGSKCVGSPSRCPEGMEASGGTCQETNCATGMVKVDKTNCCWPAQAWAGRCVGTPSCPGNFVVKGDICVEPLKGMVKVPAGEFTMGSNESGDEKPIHKVYLDAFKIDKTEVTVSAYKACVDSGNCTVPGTKWKTCNWNKSDRGDHPVDCVDWDQSVSFCEWKGKRLPTEAEWEKAAKGTSGQKYPWGSGSASCSKAVMDDGGNGCGRNRTWPVGSKPSGASPYGAQDMAGNVWEWTSDWYGSSYYSSSPSRNPTGPSSGSGRVRRGGSWGNDGGDLRASYRDYDSPSSRYDFLGFRCASPL